MLGIDPKGLQMDLVADTYIPLWKPDRQLEIMLFKIKCCEDNKARCWGGGVWGEAVAIIDQGSEQVTLKLEFER